MQLSSLFLILLMRGSSYGEIPEPSSLELSLQKKQDGAADISILMYKPSGLGQMFSGDVPPQRWNDLCYGAKNVSFSLDRKSYVNRTNNNNNRIKSTHQFTCRSGYEHFPGIGCYKLFSQEVKWYQARLTCESEGSYLAVPDSQEELEMLALLTEEYFTDFWTGIYYFRNSWKTVQGRSVTNSEMISFWSSNNYVGATGVTYVQSTGLWFTSSYSYTHPFICEQLL